MQLAQRILWSMLAVLLCLSPAMADDLGFIRIANHEQVAQATRILQAALAKVEDQFVVLASPQQISELAEAGISFELIESDADISQFSLVLPRHRGAQAERAAQVGAVAATRGGISVIRGLDVDGLDPDFFVIALEGRKIGFHYSAEVAAMLPTDNYPTDTLATKVRKDSIYSYTRRLELFQTRYVYTPQIDQARDWLVSKFQQFGYTNVTTPSFYWYGYQENVKAVKTGYAEPDQVIVVGAHYDSWNSQSDPYSYAPGSDDNGSGTAVTLEVARVLASIPLRKTVIFMPFSAEEVGLVGSAAAAADFKAAGTDLEVMFNYDMVGFTNDQVWDLDLSSGPNDSYRMFTEQTAHRVTSLTPLVAGMASNSDHYSFFAQGYPVVYSAEHDFNNEGWHTDLDLTSRMNFDYLTEVVKMSVASIAAIANAGSPTSISRIEDVGDGTSLELFWNECNPAYQYTIAYGLSSGFLNYSVPVPAGACSQVVTGLTPGIQYYFAVYGKPSDGFTAISAPVSTEMALLAPRPPRSMTAEPGDHRINLSWRRGIEQDFSYFKLYRRISGQSEYLLLVPTLTDTSFVDIAVAGSVKYEYVVTAVDLGGLESAHSTMVSSYPATFDGGVLIADEWKQDQTSQPDQAEQEAFFDTIFSYTSFEVDTLDQGQDYLEKGIAGRFSSIFWIDDDIYNKLLKNSNSTIEWYTNNTTNVLIAGWKTIANWQPLPIPSNHLLNEEFKVTSYNYSNFVAFVGATGDNGWPSVQLDPSRGFARIYELPVLTPGPGATVIYRMDAHNNDPAFEGQPAGIAYSGPNGNRVILAFPLYYLTPASATALITKARAFFNEQAAPDRPGDLDNSGTVNLLDMMNMIHYLVLGRVPADLNAADVNATCTINLLDLMTMISYLTRGYPELQPGCVAP